MRRIGLVALVALAATMLLPVATASATDPGPEADFVARTNDLRTTQGLPPLEVDAMLTAKARAWAQTMADAHQISHSHLSDGVSGNWALLGENVGTGPSVDAIHTALVHSPEHYRNLMDPGFRYVGVGVVSTNGMMYVSEVFMELASQPAPSTSASAAGTPSSSAHTAAAVALRHAAPAPPAPLPPPPPQAAPELVTTIARLRGLDPS